MVQSIFRSIRKSSVAVNYSPGHAVNSHRGPLLPTAEPSEHILASCVHATPSSGLFGSKTAGLEVIYAPIPSPIAKAMTIIIHINGFVSRI